MSLAASSGRERVEIRRINTFLATIARSLQFSGVRTELLVFSASNAGKAPQRDFRPLKTSSLDAASLVIKSG